MDYLRRDSYFAGVEYGRFDLEKMVDACRVERRGNESYLAFDHEGVYALEQLVMGKYHMAQQVYFHRVRSITDAMLVRGLTIAIQNGDGIASRLFAYDGSNAFLEAYLSFDDEHLLRALRQSGFPKVQEIFSRLADRRLFKQVCRLPLDEIPDVLDRGRLSKLNAETDEARGLERQIGKELNVDPDFVIVNRWSVKNPTYRPAGYEIKPEEILILDRRGTLRTANEFPDLIFALNTTAASREAIDVYAPRDEWNQPGGGTGKERGQCEQTVKEILISNAR
jgi:HD superfamily phosphohydrolase